MHTPNGHKHIGIVLGKITAGAHTLVYSLHQREDGTQYTRISQYLRYSDTEASVAGLALAQGDHVVDVWKTTYHVPWYYIQLQAGWDHTRLCGFDLPMAAHFGTWARMGPQ